MLRRAAWQAARAGWKPAPCVRRPGSMGWKPAPCVRRPGRAGRAGWKPAPCVRAVCSPARPRGLKARAVCSHRVFPGPAAWAESPRRVFAPCVPRPGRGPRGL